MQFNLVKDQEQVAPFVWRLAQRGMAMHCMALALGFISMLGGVPVACIILVWCFSVVSLGNTSGQRLLCTLCVRLRMSLRLCFAQRLVCWRSCAF